MADIVVENLVKRFGKQGVLAVDDVSFRVAEGELLVLLGPSGCGKTTTLRCLAGLEEPDSGALRLGSRTVFDRSSHTNVPIYRRDIGFVFQSYALWPHLTAHDNITFPLQARHVRKAERNQKAEDVAALLDLSRELLNKRPGQLSGGQQQRVSLARALVAEPSVVLFDEPLSNLDARLREQLRLELRSLHRRVGFTGVYVTHDLAEALALGDRVAVMRQGKIDQVGRPVEVFEAPSSPSTATLLGFRRVADLDMFSATEGTTAHAGRVRGPIPALPGSPKALSLFIRPDRVRVCRPADTVDGRVELSGGIIEQVVGVGTHSDVVVTFGDHWLRLVEDIEASARLRVGDEVVVEMQARHIQVYDRDGADCTARPGAGVKQETAASAVAHNA
jgi:iron(III) transport system ATP-binding protein